MQNGKYVVISLVSILFSTIRLDSFSSQNIALFDKKKSPVSSAVINQAPDAPWVGTGYDWSRWMKTFRGLTVPEQQFFKEINAALGFPIALAVAKIIIATSTHSSSSTKAPMNDQFLQVDWFHELTQMLSNKSYAPYKGMPFYNLTADTSLTVFQKNYISHHFIPALQQLNIDLQNTNGIGTASCCIIRQINNNTIKNFSIYQNNKKIGHLKPGINTVALYGAAYVQGDIVFESDSDKSSFRVSFKTGKEVIDIAHSVHNKIKKTYQAGINGAPQESDNFLCVQISKVGCSVQNSLQDYCDFPSNTWKCMSQSSHADCMSVADLLARTQCINLSQCSSQLLVTLQIEDNITVIQNKSFDQLNQSDFTVIYPSIRDITMIAEVKHPLLFLPENFNQSFIVSFVHFINLVTGAVKSQYNNLFLPDYIIKLLDAQNIVFVLKEKENMFGDASHIITKSSYGWSKDHSSLHVFPIQYMVAGLPGTHYGYTNDIPDLQVFETYLKLSQLSKK